MFSKLKKIYFRLPSSLKRNYGKEYEFNKFFR